MASLVAVSSPNARDFLNWKKLMTMFVLLAAPLPSKEDLEMYEENLAQVTAEDGSLKVEVFDQVSPLTLSNNPTGPGMVRRLRIAGAPRGATASTGGGGT